MNTQRQRILVACIPCRRRKVKCNGAKPCCKRCLQVRDKCRWPALERSYDGEQNISDESPSESPVTPEIPEKQAQILLGIFFNTPHLAFIRQSIHQPSFEATNSSSHSPFLLFAICSLAALHVSESDVLSVFNGENASDLSQRLAKVAHRHSRELSDQPSVVSVQANVILSLRELYCRNVTQAWMYAGLAIRMAQEMRLGKEYFQNRPPREQEMRRRALWTCFIMDRILCFLTARPQVFRTRHISIRLPCPSRNYLFDEGFRGPGLADFQASVAEAGEVLPFFLKAVDLWGVLIDLFGTVGNSSPEGLVENEEEFYKAHNAVSEWMGNLPHKMKWSMRSYRTFRLLGEGNLFVSMHMILNHALCTLQQAHLPQAHDIISAGSPAAAWSEEIAATCLRHANAVAEIAHSLHEGDDKDRDSLRSPFSGAAIMSSACVHLWTLRSQAPSVTDAETANVEQAITYLTDILRSWQTCWPIASSWIESIELINALYSVAYGTDGAETNPLIYQQDDGLEASSVSQSLTGSVGLPEPNNVSSRLFEKIRHIMFTISEPSARRHLQSQLHIRNLWSHMSLQAQMTSMNSKLFAGTDDISLDNSAQMPFAWDDYMTILDGQEPLP